MIIKSSFKDYYDFVAGLYGGGDPKVVYVRDRLVPPSRDVARGGSSEGWKEVEVDRLPLESPLDLFRNSGFDTRYLVVAGKAYLLYRPKVMILQPDDLSDFALIRPKELADKVNLSGAKPWRNYRYRLAGDGWVKQAMDWWGVERDYLVGLCRVVQAPVFVIASMEVLYKGSVRTGKAKVTIHGQCPVLKDLGVPSEIPPTQMYQDLAYFMGNLMNISPDKAPPVEVSNTQKILKAGLDLRWSFRHRTDKN